MSKIEIFPKVLGKYKLDHPQHLKLKEQCFKLLEKVDEEKYCFVNRSSDKLKHFFNKSNQNQCLFEGGNVHVLFHESVLSMILAT